MKFEALASSSAGNAYVVSDEETHVLLECGISHTKLQKLSGFSLSEFQACLVSHEHKDHAKSVSELISRGMAVYMSQGTAEALEADAVQLIESMEQFNVGSLDIVPFATFHDAKEPLGFLIKSRVDGDVLAFATDTVNLRYKFPGLNILAIEANYDKHILERCEKIPEKDKWLRENGYLISSGTSCNMPKQRYVEQGLFEIKESNIQNADGSVRITRTTKVTGKGQQYFINKFLKGEDNGCIITQPN